MASGPENEATPLLGPREAASAAEAVRRAVTERFEKPLLSRNHKAELRVYRQLLKERGPRALGEKVKDALKELGLEINLKADEMPEFVDECDVNDDGQIDWVEFVGILNYVIVKEVRQFIGVAEAMIRDLRVRIDGSDPPPPQKILLGEIPDLQQRLQSLQPKEAVSALEALWGTVRPEAFLRWFEAMDSPSTHKDRIRMLNCLLLTVPCRDGDGKWRSFVGNKKLISFGKLNGDRMRQDDVVVLEDSNVEFPLPEPSGDAHKAPQQPLSPAESGVRVDFRKKRNLISRVENYLLGNQEEQYLAAYTTVDLFSLRRLPYMVHAIEASSVESEVFGTPIISAILSHGWQTQSFFYVGVICDIAVICMLSGIALGERETLVPKQKTMAGIFLLSSINFLSGWVEFINFLSGWARGEDCICRDAISFAVHGVLGSFWSVYEMVVSTWFITIMCAGVRYKWDDLFTGEESQWLHDHAIWVEGLLFLKVTHVIIQLMCIRVLGQRVVPAYHALTHLSSRALLFFLFLMFVNAVLTFHAVPIDIYDPDKEDRNWWDPLENVFDIVLLQFRSAFLADFAPDELEGEEQRLRITRSNGTVQGKIVGPSQHGFYHHGLQTTNVLFIILIHILLLNVYIGVLSEQYSRFVKKEREHFEKFRAIFTRKLLLRYTWCLRCRRWCDREVPKRSCCFGRGASDGWRDGAEASRTKRTWIAYKRAMFKDPFTKEDGPE